MTIDTDKLKALALAATKGPWMRLFGERTVYDRMEDGCRGNAIVRADVGFSKQDADNLDFIAAACPATVLELIAEVERLRADAVRLDFMITDECQIERMTRPGADPLYRVRWPWEEKQMRAWSATPREAIDAAIAAKGAPCGS